MQSAVTGRCADDAVGLAFSEVPERSEYGVSPFGERKPADWNVVQGCGASPRMRDVESGDSDSECAECALSVHGISAEDLQTYNPVTFTWNWTAEPPGWWARRRRRHEPWAERAERVEPAASNARFVEWREWA